MVKRLTPGEVLRTAVKLGAIPDDASVDRKGRATWRSGEFSLAAVVHAGREGRLVWRSFVGDAKLGPAMSEFGSLMVAIESATDDSIDWPAGQKSLPVLGEYLCEGIGASRTFFIDRLDLASILASEFNVRRGRLTTWLPHPSYPARLVQALIIARDIGADELEEVIEARLRSGPQILQDGREVDIFASATRWAKQYEKAVGFAIPL